MSLAALGEDGVIEIFRRGARVRDPGVVVGNGDDAAVVAPTPGLLTVLTTDALVEGVHFRFDFASPSSIGRKLVMVNASDLAAMGARPRFALLEVVAPASLSVEVLRALAQGLHAALDEVGLELVGGNVSRIDGPLVLSLTALGEVAPPHVVRRTGAREGDALFVTGALGSARGGLELVLANLAPPPALLAALTAPVARVAAGIALGESGRVHAMCDVSDGLGRDLRRLVAGATIELARLPVLPELRLAFPERASQLALEGGEDYELLLAAPAEAEAELAARIHPLALTRIGRVTAAPDYVAIGDGGAAALPEGHRHFAAR